MPRSSFFCFPSRNTHQLSAPCVLRQQHGTALVLVLLISGVLMFLGAFGSYSARTEVAMARYDQNAKQALAYAEAGIHHAWSLLEADVADGFNDELSNGGTGGGLGSLGTSTTVNGDTYLFYHQGTAPDDGYYVRVEDNFDETTGTNNAAADTDSKIKIIALGMVGKAERVVEVTVGGNSPFSLALFGKLFVNINGTADIDSFDSSVGPYNSVTAGSEGNIGSNGNIALTGTSVLKGNATAGGTVSTTGSATVTGTSTNNAPPLTFPAVTPCGPPYSTATGITMSGSASYNSATGQLTAAAHADVVLASGTYCFNSISLVAGSTLTVNGPAKISVTGTVSLGGVAVLNTTHVAANLRLFSSYTSNGNSIILTGGSQAYMVVYAPNTGVMFDGNSDFYGSFIAGSVMNTGRAGVHYDKALQNVLGDGLKLSNWHEVRN